MSPEEELLTYHVDGEHLLIGPGRLPGNHTRPAEVLYTYTILLACGRRGGRRGRRREEKRGEGGGQRGREREEREEVKPTARFTVQ